MKEILWTQVLKSASVKRIVNSGLALSSLGLSRLWRRSIVWGVPFVVTVEPTALCNLQCPQCLTGMGKVKRKRNSFGLAAFQNLIEQLGDRIWYLLLFNQGEPFLSEHLIEFIRIAKQKKIYVTTSTNGHFLTDEQLVTNLVNSGLDTIIISLDGADPETYLKYRYQGDFQKVITGIKNLVEIRDRLRSRSPRVFIQCLVTRYNENQLPKIKELADSLGADRLLLKTLQLESRQNGEDFLPNNVKWRRYQIGKGIIKIKKPGAGGCSRLWYSTVILSDGRVVPCCFDKNGVYAFGVLGPETDIEKIWKSDPYHDFRTKILRQQQAIPICQNCTRNQTVYL